MLRLEVDFLRDETRCPVVVYKRDTYRYTGRTKSGFQMHYTKSQCARKTRGGVRCWQHREATIVAAAEKSA